MVDMVGSSSVAAPGLARWGAAFDAAPDAGLGVVREDDTNAATP
jgi:hypothetical protein